MTIVATRTHQFRRLTPRARKVWLTAHIASSVGWLGAAYTMLVLISAALISERIEFRVAPLLSVPRVERMITALPAGADTGSTGWEIVTISVCTVLVLTSVTVISVFKPWGRTRWHRRPAQ